MFIRHNFSRSWSLSTNIDNSSEFCMQVHINVNLCLSNFPETSALGILQFKYLFTFWHLFMMENFIRLLRNFIFKLPCIVSYKTQILNELGVFFI